MTVDSAHWLKMREMLEPKRFGLRRRRQPTPHSLLQKDETRIRLPKENIAKSLSKGLRFDDAHDVSLRCSLHCLLWAEKADLHYWPEPDGDSSGLSMIENHVDHVGYRGTRLVNGNGATHT